MNFRSLFTRSSLCLSLPTLGVILGTSVPALAQDATDAPPESSSVEAQSSTASSSTQAAEEVPAAPGLFASSVASSDNPSAAGSSFDFGGFVKGGVFVGKAVGESSGDVKSAFGEVAMQIRTPRETFGDGYADLRFRGGSQDNERGAFINVREAYVNAYMGPLDLRLGQQVIQWGRSSAFAPTNNLSAMDLRIRSSSDEDKRLGNFAARVNLKLNPLRIEGVWQPLYKAVEFPELELPAHVHFGKTYFPSAKTGNGTFAGRVHLELPAFEMSLSYLRGYAPMPGLAFNNVQQEAVGNETYISRVAYRHQVIGFDFATTLGDFGLRAEAAFRKPEGWETHINVPRPDVLYVVGLDTTFDTLSVIVQYMGRATLNWERAEKPTRDRSTELQQQDAASLTKNFKTISDGVNQELAYRNQGIFQQTAAIQHMAAARLEWQTLHETLSLSAFGMMNFTSKEWLLLPKVLYKFSDHISAAIGGEIYTGPEGTLLYNIMHPLNAGYVELKASF